MADRSSATLFFPPLVESNFGAYYPSLPALSSIALREGFDPTQVDLNKLFLDFVLSPGQLNSMGRGEFFLSDAADPAATPSAYARIAAKNRARFFTIDERQRSGADGLDFILAQLCEPYRLDVRLSEVSADFLDSNPVCSFYTQWFKAAVLREQSLNNSSLVAISVPMGPQLLPALLLSKQVRQVISAPIVFGGPSFSLMSSEELEKFLCLSPTESYIVQFDGETAFGSMLRELRLGGKRLENAPNTSYLRDDKFFGAFGFSKVSFDDIPVPAYDRDLLKRLESPVISVTQARGCYWGRCSYCDFIELYEGNPSYRGRRVESFVDEIEQQIAAHSIRNYSFVTESIPPSFARKVSSEILRRDVKITWSSFVMVDHRFDEELFRLMRQSGCQRLIVGMESMVDRVLKLVEKAGTVRENIRFMRSAKGASLELLVNIIPDLPSTTYAESMAALEIFQNHSELMGEVCIFPFEATQSSAIGRDPSKFGLIPEADTGILGQAQYANNRLSWSDPAMTADERQRALNQYLRFAASHNRKVLHSKNCSLDSIPRVEPVTAQIDTAFLDFHSGPEYGTVTNAATGMTVSVPLEWIPILSKINLPSVLQIE